MLPIYGYLSRPTLRSKKFNIIKYFKALTKYLLIYQIPRTFGNLFDKIYFGRILNNVLFVRADCDHFGSWCYLFLLDKTEKKFKYFYKICLAKRNTIDSTWINFFKSNKIIIIYNPFLQFILSPFFFSTKFGIDVNGQIPLSYYLNKISYKKFKRISETNTEFLKNISYKKQNHRKNKNLEKIFSRKLVLLYGRSGNWKFSRKNSKRNMPPEVFQKLIDIIGKKYNVFLLGDSGKIIHKKKEFIYSEDSLKNKEVELPIIYKNAKCVIGSVSGCAHFPSILFNKPALFFADIPFLHVPAYYFLSYIWDNNFDAKNLVIPKNDFWFLIDQANFKKLSLASLESILSGFLDFNYPNIDNNFYKLNNKSENKGGIFINNNYQLTI
tara:strand:+ start:272 stop:1417 length:1146 start_codon:yes stop_codon:yes gene_type:complete